MEWFGRRPSEARLGSPPGGVCAAHETNVLSHHFRNLTVIIVKKEEYINI
jgi:hypothetical protein